MSTEIQAAGAAAGSFGNPAARALPLAVSAAPAAIAATARTVPIAHGAATQSPAADAERRRSAVQELERKLDAARTDLQFKFDGDLHELIVSVVNAQDGTVIRQVPSEVAQRIARLLDQQPGGLIETVA